MTPQIAAIRQNNTHRLIPARYSDDSMLRRLAENDADFDALTVLDSSTNERLLGEANLLPGIGVHELLFGVPHAFIVNAAFTHAHPLGSRFNGSDRGAWYAGFELKTAQAEVAFHKSGELREIGWREPETFTYDDYLADFIGDFHELRESPAASPMLDPFSYDASQQLARKLLASGSAGVVYPSVRRANATCIVCFRPALVTHVRQGTCLSLKFHNGRFEW